MGDVVVLRAGLCQRHQLNERGNANARSKETPIRAAGRGRAVPHLRNVRLALECLDLLIFVAQPFQREFFNERQEPFSENHCDIS